LSEPHRRALLIVDHGSRSADANRQLEELAARVRAARPELVVELAHMEIAPPTIADGVAGCVRAGAREVVVCPWFLGPGRHTTETIPELVARAAADYDGLHVRIAEPLGIDERLIEVLLSRAADAG
jgi:sirohydrochlorin ferrochelatase